MSYKERAVSTFTKPLIVAGISCLASMAFNSGNELMVRLPVTGNIVSLHTYLGILGGLSSLGTQTVSNWILPYVPMNGKYASYEASLMEPAVNGALDVALTYFEYPAIYKEVGAIKLFGIGVTGQFGGDYVENNFLMSSFKY
jgi:hypothetical protein